MLDFLATDSAAGQMPAVTRSAAEQAVAALKNGEVLLLENVRFHVEEEANDPAFSKQLAALGDLFVNDAFGAAHRAHASTSGIASHLPAYAGFLLEKELEMLGKSLDHPARPFIAIVGGAKVSLSLAFLKAYRTRLIRW